MVQIMCEHNQVQRLCEICELKELLAQYREIIMRYVLDEQDEFQHLNDLVYALRDLDPEFDALYDA